MHLMALALHWFPQLSEMLRVTESPQDASTQLKTVQTAAGLLLLKSYKNNPVAQPFPGWCSVLCRVNRGRLVFSTQRTGWRCQKPKGVTRGVGVTDALKGQQASCLSMLKHTAVTSDWNLVFSCFLQRGEHTGHGTAGETPRMATWWLQLSSLHTALAADRMSTTDVGRVKMDCICRHLSLSAFQNASQVSPTFNWILKLAFDIFWPLRCRRTKTNTIILSAKW